MVSTDGQETTKKQASAGGAKARGPALEWERSLLAGGWLEAGSLLVGGCPRALMGSSNQGQRERVDGPITVPKTTEGS